jgi:hypothetical protein
VTSRDGLVIRLINRYPMTFATVVIVLLVVASFVTPEPEPTDAACDVVPESQEPASCARDHWAN